MSLCNPAVGMVYCSYKEARMTAQQIALDWHHAIQAHDARQFGIEQLSRTVRDLRTLAESLGIREETVAAYEALRDS